MRNVNKSKCNNAIREVFIVIALACMVLLSCLADGSIISVPKIFVLTFGNSEDLFLTLFSVQASVSTVGIAIVTIIAGFTNDYIYGVSLSGFITTLKPVFLKHNVLIISNLIIVFINYFCVSYSLFNTSIALFTISIVITIILMKKAFVIFLGKERIKKEIYEYVLNNYSKSIIADLGRELIKAIEIGDSLVIKEDYLVIKSILQKEVESTLYKESEITKQISDIVADALEKVSYQHNSKRSNDCLLFIAELYEIANKGEVPLKLDIWECNSKNYFRALKDLTYEQLRDDYVYYRMHTQLYKNLESYSNKDVSGNILRYYSSWVYFALLDNDNRFDVNERKCLQKEIYEQSYVKLFYGTTAKTDSSIGNLLLSELCNLNKLIIDKGHTKTIKENLFKHYRYGQNSTYHDVLLIVTLIYLYYLSSREKYVEGKDIQKSAQLILEENKSIIRHFYYRMDLVAVVKEYYQYIKDLLDKWEYMNEGEAKWIIMDYVILDFFVFTAINKYWNSSDISEIIEYLEPDSMFILYNRYFSDKDVTSLINMLKEYNRWFSRDEDKLITERISALRDVCNERYKKETIESGENRRISEEKMRTFTESVKKTITDFVNAELSDFSFKTRKEDNIELNEKQLIFACVLSDYFFTPEGVDAHILEHLTSSTVEAYIRVLLKYINHKKVKFDDREKQKTLIEMVEALEISPDLVIGSRDVFWGEDDKDMLSNYTETMKKVKYPGGYNFSFIFDSTMIEISLDNIEVEYKDLSWEEIEEKCKILDDGQITYNVTNDLYIPFEKDELIKHITNTKKRVLIYADIKYRISGEKVGAGIEVIAE